MKRATLLLVFCTLGAVWGSRAPLDPVAEAQPDDTRARYRRAADHWLHILSEYAHKYAGEQQVDRPQGFPAPFPVDLPIAGPDGKSVETLPLLVLPLPVPVYQTTKECIQTKKEESTEKKDSSHYINTISIPKPELELITPVKTNPTTAPLSVTYAPSKSEFTAPEPEYTPPKSEYTPPKSEYTPTKPEYTPAEPEYTPAEPEYTPSKPEYTPSKPEYTPANPEYTPTKPEYTPAKPEYTPSKPEYTPAKPEYTPAKPEYTPAKSEYTPAKPEFTPPKPQYTPPKPQYTTSKPQYTTFKPQYTTFKPQYTTFKPQYPTFKPEYKPTKAQLATSTLTFTSKPQYPSPALINQQLVSKYTPTITFGKPSSYPRPTTQYPEPAPQTPEGASQYPSTASRFSETSFKQPAQQETETPQQYPEPTQQYPQPTQQYPETTQQYPKPAQQYPEPAQQYPKPAQQYPEPAQQYPKPAQQYPEPAQQYPKPAQQYPEPAQQYPKPAQQYPEPAQQYPKPAQQYPEPAQQYPKPAQQYPEPAQQYPKPAQQYPEPAQQYPQPAQQYPEPAQQYPQPAQQDLESTQQILKPAQPYSEPAQQLLEPTEQYPKPAQQYSEFTQQYPKPAQQYLEPAQQYPKPAQQYSEPAEQYPAPIAQTNKPAQQYPESSLQYQQSSLEFQAPIVTETYEGYSTYSLVEMYRQQSPASPELPPVVLTQQGLAPQPATTPARPSPFATTARPGQYVPTNPFATYSFNSLNRNPPLPRFDRPMQLRAELYVPQAGYTEPYTLWWSPTYKAARVDFHGGATSTYFNILPNRSVQRVEVRLDRSGVASDVHRCGTATQQLPFAELEALQRYPPAFPDLKLFSFAGYTTTNGGRAERWQYETTGKAGELGAARGEKLTFHHELQLTRGADGISALPQLYTVTVDSSVLGARFNSYQHRYSDVRYQQLAADLFRVDLNATCDVLEKLDPNASNHAARLDPLREFTRPARDPRYDAFFELYKQDFNRKYADDTEEAVRKALLIQKIQYITSGNREGATFQMGVNFLSDRLDAELQVLLGAQLEPEGIPAEPFPYASDKLGQLAARLPEEFDWRSLGAVTPARYQGACSSCWAFAVTGAVEGALFVRSRRLVPLSEQSLLDCGHETGAHGCRGTWPSRAYDYVQEHGLPALDEYTPYQAKVAECREREVQPVTHISGHVNVTANNVQALKLAIRRNGPTIVLIDGQPSSLLSYKSGVYRDERCSTKKFNHAVLAVGWGKQNDVDYFILKNSWSSSWGESGFVRMAASSCGLLGKPSYPRLELADIDRLPAGATAAPALKLA